MVLIPWDFHFNGEAWLSQFASHVYEVVLNCFRARFDGAIRAATLSVILEQAYRRISTVGQLPRKENFQNINGLPGRL